MIGNVIVLDLDDTLYLERDYVLSGFRAVGNWLKAHHEIRTFAESATELFEAGRRGDIFDAALARLGASPSPELIQRLVAVYREHRPDIRLQSDAARFLTRERTGRALAMLTDGELCCQQAKIAALGLNRSDIMPIICTGQWGRSYWKPHRRGFEDIQSHYRLPPSAFVYIADNPVKDFIAPRALGWRTVQIIRPGGIHSAYNPDPADLSITSLDELTEESLGDLFRAPENPSQAALAIDSTS